MSAGRLVTNCLPMKHFHMLRPQFTTRRSPISFTGLLLNEFQYLRDETHQTRGLEASLSSG